MTDPGQQYPPPTGYAGYSSSEQSWQGAPPPPAKGKSGFPTWAKILLGVIAAIALLSIGVAAGGGPAKVETKTVAGPKSTVTATSTVAVTATVTETPPPPTATVTTTFTPQPVVAFGDGQFVVPTEVEPGNYKTPGASGCYYAFLSDLSGGIQDNGFAEGPTTITVPSSAAGLRISGGCQWSKA